MGFTEQDRQALYAIWMSQKAKMRMTQMEMAKRLEMTQSEFAALLSGKEPLNRTFINHFCDQMCINPIVVIPSLQHAHHNGERMLLKSKMVVEGDIQQIYAHGNEIVVEYYPPQ
ncbi:transcriptional regulator [Thaumasiovibrio subtropicus]|uniref:transcriptional regulator n=1 Tax=Thaumasiovibrio subtropicus TaxID=1891207 RepID=UPI000B355D8E|nr:transcriptional regulator [Thaumasiovibrio subtropicus]